MKPSLAIVLLLFLALCACRREDARIRGDQRDYDPKALSEDNRMQAFLANHPQHEVLKYAEGDLNNDGQQDLIVIYRVGKEENRMCLLVSDRETVTESNSVPAPVADQSIRFKNIDDKPPMEFIVQGRKGALIGYAIFRLEDGNLVDLFGDGFENCC